MMKCITCKGYVVDIRLWGFNFNVLYINEEGCLRSNGDYLGNFKDRGKPRKPVAGPGTLVMRTEM
jgi:hypothetical protein